MFGPRPLPPANQPTFSPFMRGPGSGAGMARSSGAAGQFGQFNSMFGGAPQAGMRQSGGLLSRLFGGGGAQAAGSSARGLGGLGGFGGMGSSAGASAGAGPLATLTNAVSNGGGINSVLGLVQNAQKAVQVVQTVGPMVQQYGPLVRSLPQLMAIMRSSDSSDEDETEASDQSNDGIDEENSDQSSEEVIEINKKTTKKKKPVKKTLPAVSPKRKRRKKRTQSQVQISKKKEKSPKKDLPGPKLYV